MSKTYHHLSHEERWQIHALHTSGYSCRKIGLQLGRSPTTIALELKRGRRVKEDGYSPRVASMRYLRSKKHSGRKRRKLHGKLWRQVRACLIHRWSPEQIAGRLALDGVATISHTSIYTRIWRECDPIILRCLRHKGKRYRKRGKAGRSCIPGRVDISERPNIVALKQRLGDWEGDTVVSGKDGAGALVTLVDRASKYTLVRKVERKTAQNVKQAIVALLRPHKQKTHTLTFDNGTEFAKHAEVSHFLKAKTYFATPYHSWERGLNEHTNGLIRQFFPKKTNFKHITDMEVEGVQKLLNNRPRKVLNYQTPAEVFMTT